MFFWPRMDLLLCGRLFAAIAAVALMAADCIAAPSNAREQHPAREVSSRELATALIGLSPRVSRQEAAQLADRAYRASSELAADYRVVGPALFQNFLVNIGARKRGLCFQWTEDLTRRLQALRVKTLQLHWGEARAGTWREHNCVVVTARGQRFDEGVVLDAWRYSGRLFWSPVRADHYAWMEDSSDYMARQDARAEQQNAKAAAPAESDRSSPR